MSIIKYISQQFGKPTGINGTISTSIMNIMNQTQYKGIINNLNCSPNDRILDIGFGNGYLINNLAKISQATFHGIEISDDMIKTGCKRNRKLIEQEKVHLTKGDVMDIPFENAYFDKIYTVNTVYFWKDLDKSLLEIKRVLKPNGTFINAIYSKEWLDKIRYTQHGFYKYSPDELVKITSRNGLNILNVIETKKGISYCIISKLS